jgi:hypothetical protein
VTVQLPPSVRGDFLLVAAFVPGDTVPRTSDLPIRLGYERTRRIDAAVTAALESGPEQLHSPVLTRPGAPYDLVTTSWQADFGNGFAILDPDYGAHFWQSRTNHAALGRIETIKDLRRNGWTWVPLAEQPERAVPSAVDVEQFTTAVITAEAVAAALALRPPEAVGPSVAAELADIGPGADLGRLGWGWSLSWAAEYLGVAQATQWRKTCEHQVRGRHPQLAEGYYRRLPFTTDPNAMSTAAGLALERARGRFDLPGLDEHLVALRGRAEPSVFSRSLGEIRRGLAEQRMVNGSGPTLGVSFDFGGRLVHDYYQGALVDDHLDRLPPPETRASSNPPPSRSSRRGNTSRQR